VNERELIDFLRLLAEKSGEVIRPFFANPDLKVELKADQSPVTIADRRAEEVMRGLIKERYPDHGIIGEEYGDKNTDAQFVWALDPIDGTRPFTAGCPLFGTLICLLEEGEPKIGAIHNPVLSQLMIGNNLTTTLNGRSVEVGNTTELAEARLLTCNVDAPAEYQDGEKWEALRAATADTFTWGDCYGYLLLAAGGADIMVDPTMNPWDLLALIPVIRGAGGVISDWHGNDPVKGNSIVAANPVLHPQVIKVLND
jgi:myo-inositol-1(or 4)-monophosphatase